MNKIVDIEQGNPDITDKIKNMVLKQVIPERKNEIDKIFENLQIRSQAGVTGYRAEANSYAIFLSDQTIIINHLITELFYKGLKETACKIFTRTIENKDIDFFPLQDIQQLDIIKNVLSWSEEEKEFKWHILDDSFITHTVEKMFEEPISVEERCIRDLDFISLSFIVLHEIGHLVKGYGSSPEEELKCDEYAREFILGDVYNYILTERDNKLTKPRARVINKRLTGLNTAHFIIGIVEQLLDVRNRTHPPMSDRLYPLLERAKSFEEINYDVSEFTQKACELMCTEIIVKGTKGNSIFFENELRKIYDNHGPMTFWNTLAASLMALFQIKNIKPIPSKDTMAFCFNNVKLL